MVKFIFIGTFCILLASCFGLPLDNGRIVGGIDAKPAQFPHQISLRRGSHTCGGSIISANWVLTAAHCVGSPSSAYTVVAGSNSLRSGGVTRRVKQIIVHEGHRNFQNDIALIELAEPLPLSKTINIIKLAKQEVPTGGNILISGWGRLYTGGPIPDKLQYNTNIRRLAPQTCKAVTGSIYYNGLICLQHSSGHGACNGDSGGPATHNGELVGIAGFVIGGCGSGNPDGYAKVSYFIDWINEHTKLDL